MPFRNGNTYRALGWLVATALFFGAALAQESQEVEPATIKSQPVPEGGQDTSKDGAADQGQNNEPTPEKLSPSLNRIEAAIRDLIAQERTAQGQGPKDNEIRDLEAQEGMALWAKAMFWATGAAVILTFAGIALIWRTLHHTRRAADHTEGMLGEARETTKAARAAVEVASDSAKRQLRAYIGFGQIEIKWGADTRITTEVNFVNHGTTPAYQVRYYANASVSNAEVDFSTLPIEPSQTTADLPQHGRFNASLFTAPLGTEQFTRAQKGELPAIFWGRLEYKDTFGKDRFVEYRYKWDARVGKLVAMSEGNESD